MRKRHILAFVVAISALSAGAVMTVAAYEGQVPAHIRLTGSCDGSRVTAHVTDSSGAAVTDQSVEVSLVEQADAGDAVAPSTIVTDQNGDASTTLQLANAPGKRVIKAEAGEAAGTLTLDCRAGLPPTSTAPAGDATLPAALAAGALAAAVLGLLVVRARRFARD